MSGQTGMYSDACGLFWHVACQTADPTLKGSGGSGAPEGALKTEWKRD